MWIDYTIALKLKSMVGFFSLTRQIQCSFCLAEFGLFLHRAEVVNSQFPTPSPLAMLAGAAGISGSVTVGGLQVSHTADTGFLQIEGFWVLFLTK